MNEELLDLNKVLEDWDVWNIWIYAYLNKQKLSPEWERILLEVGGSHTLMMYTTTVRGGRWEEAEPTIKQSPFCWNHYCYHFKLERNKDADI